MKVNRREAVRKMVAGAALVKLTKFTSNELRKYNKLERWLFSEEVPQGSEAGQFFLWRKEALGF